MTSTYKVHLRRIEASHSKDDVLGDGASRLVPMHGLRHLEVEIHRGLTFLHHFVFSNVETGALAEDLEEKTGLRLSRNSGGLKLEQGFSCSRT